VFSKKVENLLDSMDIRAAASERAWSARADLEEIFSSPDPGTGYPIGKFIRVRDESDVLEDGTVDIDFSVKIDWARCSVRDFLRIADVLRKHFPEFVTKEESDVETSTVARLLTRGGICVSQSEAKRLIAQGAVRLDGEKVTDPLASVTAGEHTLRVGKKFEGLITVEDKP
jgi:hypothetical protein